MVQMTAYKWWVIIHKKCLKINILTREFGDSTSLLLLSSFTLLCRNECILLLLLLSLFTLCLDATTFYSWSCTAILLRFIYSIYLIMFALVFLFRCCCRCFRYYYCCYLPFTEEHCLIPFSITITLYDGARFIMMVFYSLLLLLLLLMLLLLLLPLSPLPLPWPLPQFHSAVFHCNMFCMCVIDQLFRTFRIVSI